MGEREERSAHHQLRYVKSFVPPLSIYLSIYRYIWQAEMVEMRRNALKLAPQNERIEWILKKRASCAEDHLFEIHILEFIYIFY